MRQHSVPLTFALALAIVAAPAAAQRSEPPTAAELAAITERGRALAAYDVAAWYATDSLIAIKPDTSRLGQWIARQDGARWTVSFGKLNVAADTFFVAYEAVQGDAPMNFRVRTFEPASANTGFELHAAKALMLAKAVLRQSGRRYYNVAVLPADSGRLWAYATPAPTRHGYWPLGADFRLLVSADGGTILENRKLHNTALEFGPPKPGVNGSDVTEDFSTAVLDVVPEDTDVMFTIRREPNIPHLVMTDKYTYRIAPDGTITYLGLTADFVKKVKGGSTPPGGL